jgi:hypothetical protein
MARQAGESGNIDASSGVLDASGAASRMNAMRDLNELGLRSQLELPRAKGCT